LYSKRPGGCEEPVPTTGERRSLQKISRELAAKGYVNERGRPFNPKSVRVCALLTRYVVGAHSKALIDGAKT
jgi:hypothetical protein